MIGLLKNGEHRLLRAAESVPLSIAVEIADAEDIEVQSVLQNAYAKPFYEVRTNAQHHRVPWRARLI